MNVIVPYTRVTGALPIAARYIRVPDRDDGYWWVLGIVWHRGASFINVEHDISPGLEALVDLWECPEPWCTQPYTQRGIGLIKNALGCTKFSAEAINAAPGLFEIIRAMPFPNDPTRSCTHWRGLDQFMLRVLEQLGLKRHEHNLEVGHWEAV